MSKKLYKNNVRLNDYQGVNRLLQRVINGVIQDEISEEKAKVISTLCNTLLKSLDGDISREEIQARIDNTKANTHKTIKSVGDENTTEEKIELYFEQLGEIIDKVDIKGDLYEVR